MKTSYVFLAEGFEEIEAIATVDVMRRAGMSVYTVSISEDLIVTGAHGVPVQADLLMADADFADADWLVMPGGMPGAANLALCAPLCELINAHSAAGKGVAAICAAPAVVLAPIGLLNGREATCYPGFEGECVKNGAKMVDKPVVVDGNIVTGNGPASAVLFGLTIAAQAMGSDVAAQVGSGMLCK